MKLEKRSFDIIDDSNSVFFFTQGEVRVNYNSISGQEVILCDLAVGEIFGELTAIDGQSRSENCYCHSAKANWKIRRLTEQVFESDTLKVPIIFVPNYCILPKHRQPYPIIRQLSQWCLHILNWLVLLVRTVSCNTGAQ